MSFLLFMKVDFLLSHVISPHPNHSYDLVDPVNMVFNIVVQSRLIPRLPGISQEHVLGWFLDMLARRVRASRIIHKTFSHRAWDDGSLWMTGWQLRGEYLLDLLVIVMEQLMHCLLIAFLCHPQQRIFINLFKFRQYHAFLCSLRFHLIYQLDSLKDCTHLFKIIFSFYFINLLTHHLFF